MPNPTQPFGWQFLDRVDIVSATAAFLFTTSANFGSYKMYRVYMEGIVPTDDDDILSLRVSNDAGSNYEAGTQYASTETLTLGTSEVHTGSAGTAQIRMVATGAGNGVDNTETSGGYSGEVTIIGFDQSTRDTQMYGQGVYVVADGNEPGKLTFSGQYETNEALNAFEILFIASTIEKGTCYFFGLNVPSS